MRSLIEIHGDITHSPACLIRVLAQRHETSHALDDLLSGSADELANQVRQSCNVMDPYPFIRLRVGDLTVDAFPINNETFLVADRTDECQDLDTAVGASTHDYLTGLLNRRGMIEHWEERVSSHNEKHSVLFIDLDDFKPVNDTYGHHVGDVVLSVIADRLSFAIRELDMVSRIGGDEFVIILHGVHEEDEIDAVIDRIFRLVNGTIHVDKVDVHVTCSIGIASVPDDGTDIQSLLEIADSRMYMNKKQTEFGTEVSTVDDLLKDVSKSWSIKSCGSLEYSACVKDLMSGAKLRLNRIYDKHSRVAPIDDPSYKWVITSTDVANGRATASVGLRCRGDVVEAASIIMEVIQ